MAKVYQFLAEALCEAGLASGFAEVRRLVSGGAIKINGYSATSYDEAVKDGDVITIGKHKQMTVGEHRKENAMGEYAKPVEESENDTMNATVKTDGDDVTITFTLPEYVNADSLGAWDEYGDGAHFFNDLVDSANSLDELFTYAAENTHRTRDEIRTLVLAAMRAVFETLE